MMEQRKDIFISYKNDGEGNNFAARLCVDLERLGYDVYYNPNEQHAGSFPDRLRNAVESCKDFLLVLTQSCLEQLIRHDKIDWVREELLTANCSGKNIIPLLMPGVSMPKDKDEMPEDLRFLPDKDAISMSNPYDRSPLDFLLSWVISKPIKDEIYRDVFSSNKNYDVKSDFASILERANNGDLHAMYEAAFYYFDGITAAVDYENAAYWLLKLSECEEEELRSHANALLGAMYYSGTVPKESQSYERSFYYRNISIMDEEAQMQAAFMKKIGSGCEFDYNEIEKGYQKVKNGDEVNKLNHALFYITYGEFDKAIDVLENMENFLPEAEYQLGLLYKLGVQVKPPKPDYITAAYHFHNAAEQGHLAAAYEYGAINFNPTGKYRKNFKQAEKYLKIAADGGIADAQHKLGWIYRFGLSGQINLVKAIEYFERAAAQGHAGSLEMLSDLYQIPGHINYHRSFNCAKKVADMGGASAAYKVANFYFIGRGCEVNENKAYEYYRKAYEHGIYRAKIMMDKMKQGNLLNEAVI